MKETIYTIPISEIFEPMCGCPLCILEKTLDERWVEYITGAAMMEPDVRIETNKHGFCGRHFNMMLTGSASRLSLALILQTRLEWIDENLGSPSPKESGRLWGLKRRTRRNEESCFVCLKIEHEKKRIAANIASVWKKENDFRELFSRQEFLCHRHAQLLLHTAHEELSKQELSAFYEATATLTRKKLRSIKADIDAFCNLFDYRNAGSAHPGENVSTSVERAIAYLTSDNTGFSGKG